MTLVILVDGLTFDCKLDGTSCEMKARFQFNSDRVTVLSAMGC